MGRSTQINLLKPWLEQLGRAVLDTGLSRSAAGGAASSRPRKAHPGPHHAEPLLRHGFCRPAGERDHSGAPLRICGADRPLHLFPDGAGDRSRRSIPTGCASVYGFALRPDAIFYLRIKVDDLVTRVLQSTGFDYWESGTDLHMGEDMYESFVRYQKWLLAEFDKNGRELWFSDRGCFRDH